MARLKAATVLVWVEGSRGSGAVSGIFFHKDAGAGYVVTAARPLVNFRRAGTETLKFQVDFGFGTGNERRLAAELSGQDLPRDLAVLRVKAEKLPEPISLSDDEKIALRETMPIYVLGFVVTQGRPPQADSAARVFYPGKLLAVFRNKRREITRLILDYKSQGQQVYGLAVDGGGRPLGVAQSNQAQPLRALRELFVPRLGRVMMVQTADVKTKKMVLRFAVHLIDPFQRANAPSLRFTPVKDNAPLPQVPDDGNWRPIDEKMKSVKLTGLNEKDAGNLPPPLRFRDTGGAKLLLGDWNVPPKKDAKSAPVNRLTAQLEFKGADGQPRYSPPINVQYVGFMRPGPLPPLKPGPAPAANPKPRKSETKLAGETRGK